MQKTATRHGTGQEAERTIELCQVKDRSTTLCEERGRGEKGENERVGAVAQQRRGNKMQKEGGAGQ